MAKGLERPASRTAPDVATRLTDDPSRLGADPDQRFGKPAIGGISTEVIWEHADAGADEVEIAETFDLSPPANATPR